MRLIIASRIVLDGSLVGVNYADVADYYGLQVINGTDFQPNGSSRMETAVPPATPKMLVSWSDAETNFMLASYRKYMTKVGPLQQLKNKKQLWEKISSEMFAELCVEFSPTQVENRWKNVLKRSKIAARNNRISGSTIMRTGFEAEMAKITAQDDSIEPEILMTPTFIKRNQKKSARSIKS